MSCGRFAIFTQSALTKPGAPNLTLHYNHLGLDKSSKEMPCRPLQSQSLGRAQRHLNSVKLPRSSQLEVKFEDQCVVHRAGKEITYEFKYLWKPVRW